MPITDENIGKYAFGEKFEIELNGSTYIVKTYFNTESKSEAKDIISELIKMRIKENYGQSR